MEMTTGFIGGGRITKIFLQAFFKAHRQLRNCYVFDVNKDITSALKNKFQEIHVDDFGTTASRDILVLALHPPSLKEMLGNIRDLLSEDQIIVSLAPKITISDMMGALGNVQKIVRMIPNAPSVVGKGYNPVCFSGAFSKSEKESLLQYFSPLGESPEVQEKNLEAYAIIAAMGPTYLWFQLYKLAELSLEFGLTEKETSDAIVKMVMGSVALMYSQYSREEVLDMIPVRPIGEYENEILKVYDEKLKGLFEKLRS